MVVTTTSEETNISDRASDTGMLAEAQDVSGDGVQAWTSATRSTTLYLHAAAAVEVEVEVSPDGGSTWYTLPESPVVFGEQGDDAVKIEYDFNRIRLTGSNATNVTAQVREVV